MKDSINYSQDPTAMQHDICSEKKCATCFENRGCIYEQYFLVGIQNMEKFHAGSQINIANSATKNEHNSLAKNYPFV